MHGVFLTGTDTGVGKTFVGCALTRALGRAGIPVAVRKPVESGCERRQGILYPADGIALARAAGEREKLERVTPLRLAHAISPERAARLEGIEVTIADLVEAVEAGAPGDFRLVEGAGGILSPLALDGLNADLAIALGLPVIVVVADRLGCINHALLTVEAIERRGLTVQALVLNALEADAGTAMSNRDDLAARVEVPVFAFPHGRGERRAAEAAADELAELFATSRADEVGMA